MTPWLHRVSTRLSVPVRVADVPPALRWLTYWTSGWLAILLLWSSLVGADRSASRIVVALCQALLVAACAFAPLALAGFLFGIPRSLAVHAAARARSKAGGASPTRAAGSGLELVVDWLTKILVGLSLAHVRGLWADVHLAAEYLAIGGAPSATLAVMVNFAATGFVAGYLVTKLYLGPVLREAERHARDGAARVVVAAVRAVRRGVPAD